MNISKTTLACSLIFSALFAMGADEDRSYVSDFVGKSVTLSMKDASGKINTVTLKSAKPSELVFADASGGGEFTVPTNNVSSKFAYSQVDDLNRSLLAYNRGELDLAIAGLRPYIYPLIGMLVLPESSFYQFNETLELFVRSLIKSGRVKEASALVKVLPLTNANIETQRRAIEIGKVLVSKGDAKSAIDILNRIPLTEEYIDIYPEVMEFAAAIRKLGVTQDIQRFYAQLGNAENNPMKSTCQLWAIYCEIMRGSLTSAKLSLGTLKGAYKRTDKEFPLYKMVDGIRAIKEKNYPEALDSFAEGIVFAKASDVCLPELLYNTACAYKHEKNITAANEIFRQISMLYPDDPLAAISLKEIVKEEKKDTEEDSQG